MKRRTIMIGLAALALPALAADPGLPLLTSQPSGAGQSYSLTLQTLLFLTSLTFLPAVLLMMTAFTRIVIVLSLLRQSLGEGPGRAAWPGPPSWVRCGAQRSTLGPCGALFEGRTFCNGGT